MPYPVNQARRHPFPKARYRVSNWHEYDQALQNRGSFTVWVTPEAIAAWQAPPTGPRGRSPFDSDLAIETGHLLRLAFGRPWRRTEGLLRSVVTLLGVGLAVPDHTTFSRRSTGLSLPTSRKRSSEPVHVVIDSTGLKVYGAGEWQREKHGARPPHWAQASPGRESRYERDLSSTLSTPNQRKGHKRPSFWDYRTFWQVDRSS
jgi:Transposase DDE domain